MPYDYVNIAIMANPTEALFQANRNLFTSRFTKDPDLLESVLRCFKERGLVSDNGGSESEDEKAAFLWKTIDMVSETDESLVLDIFKQHQQLQDILTDFQAKSKAKQAVTSHSEIGISSSTASHPVSTGGAGYDDDLFLTAPPKDYQCPICYLVLREPLLYSCCGVHVCQECAGHSVTDRCPACNQTTFTSILDKGLRGKILSLRVKCRNSPCSWEGELLDLDNHIDKACLHARVPCPLDCGQSVARSDLEDHEELWCKNRPSDVQVVGMQRLLLAEIIRAKESSSNNAGLLLKLLSDVSSQIETIIMETRSSYNNALSKTEATVMGITEESSRLKERLKLAEAQVDRYGNLLKQEIEKKKIDNRIMKGKDMEIHKLTMELEQLKSRGTNLDCGASTKSLNQLTPEAEESQHQRVNEDIPSQEVDHKTPLMDDVEEEEKQQPLPTMTDEGEGMVEDQLNSKGGSCSTVDVVEHSNGRDVSIQFDYWVPMKDLLYGAVVVDETVFNVHGDQEQSYNWTECGFSLHIPSGSLDRTETCPVAVKTLISGRFKLPDGFQLISALYAISPGRKFKKKVEMSIQHCFLIEREDQLKRLSFIKACATPNPNDPYEFEYVDGGVFTIGDQYCQLHQKEFSIYAAGVQTTGADGSSNPSSHDTGQQDTTEDEIHDTSTHDDHHDPDNDPAPPLDSRESNDNSIHHRVSHHDDHNDPDDDPAPPILNQQGSTTDGSTHGYSNTNNRGLVEGGASEPTICNPLSTASGYIPIKYRAHFFYEEDTKRPNSWYLELVAVQELNAHIKYVSNHLNSRKKCESFQFFFLDQPDAAIHYGFTDERMNRFPSGWFVRPITEPCSISKEEVDTLAIQEQRIQSNEDEVIIPDIPTRKVRIFADSNCTCSLMEYKVAITGIRDTKTFNIIRQLDQTNGGAGQYPSNVGGGNSNGAVQPDNNREYARITDLKKFKSILSEQFNHQFADLKDLFSGTLERFADRLFQNGMISSHVKSNPNFDTVMNEVMSSLKFKRKAHDIIEHCRKLLRSMSDIGAPQSGAATSIAESMEEVTMKEFNVAIKFTVE